MDSQNFFSQAFIYLMAAVVSVPISKKLGLGSVLGYLIAGIVIGPFVLGLIDSKGDNIGHFAEFGVVMMLFLVGLEFKPSLLWRMRQLIFGLGGLQLIFSSLAIATAFYFMGYSSSQSAGIGLILSLSSTAIVLQTLNEKNMIKTRVGRSSFSVLLFQDIAVIPILAILPILASGRLEDGMQPSQNIASLSGWVQLLLILCLVLGIIVIGRFLTKYIFRFIASSGIREIFTAAALLLVISIAIAMDKVGLSPALGTFLAGVVLADSEYRHELESDIEPFKGLLLGLFFISVGMGIDFNLILEKPLLIVLLLVGLVTFKSVVLLVLSRFFGLKADKGWALAISLAQGSEFAFVLIGFSLNVNLFSQDLGSILTITVALSMAMSPLLFILNEKLIRPLYKSAINEPEADKIENADNDVIIAGFGRFGLVVGRLLIANGIKATVLDDDLHNINALKKFGMKVYYGDASRPDLLKAAGVENAKVLVMALDNREKALSTTAYLKRTYPNLEIVARAIDIKHLYQYYSLGVNDVKTEVFNSAIELGTMTLRKLGWTNYSSYRAAQIFKKHNQGILSEMYQHWLNDRDKYITETKRHEQELIDLLRTEKLSSIHDTDHAWDISTLQQEAKDLSKKH